MSWQEEKAELKAANHRLMKEKALLQSNVQDQRNSSDEHEDHRHCQVMTVWSLVIQHDHSLSNTHFVSTVTQHLYLYYTAIPTVLWFFWLDDSKDIPTSKKNLLKDLHWGTDLMWSCFKMKVLVVAAVVHWYAIINILWYINIMYLHSPSMLWSCWWVTDRKFTWFQ